MRFKILIICVNFTLIGNSMCIISPNSVQVFPKNKTINRNPQFLIESKGFRKDFLSEYVFYSNPVYLFSKDDTIRLSFLDRHFNKGNTDQFLFSPKEPLKPNTKYLLKIPYYKEDSLVYFEKWFLTSKTIDTISPNWIQAPKHFLKSYVRYGCGDEKLLSFPFKVSKKESCFVLIDAINNRNFEHVSFFMPLDGNEFEIGQTMCDRNCIFFDSTQYLITMTLVDASGNSNLTNSKHVFFNGEFISKSIKPKINSKLNFIIIGVFAFVSFLIVAVLRRRKKKTWNNFVKLCINMISFKIRR